MFESEIVDALDEVFVDKQVRQLFRFRLGSHARNISSTQWRTLLRGCHCNLTPINIEDESILTDAVAVGDASLDASASRECKLRV